MQRALHQNISKNYSTHKNKVTILVTGASGYIGSHLCLALLDIGYDVLAIDNLSNSSRKIIDKLELINENAKTKLRFRQIDLLNHSELNKCFNEEKVQAVIHLAALKSVGESCSKPLLYHSNNVGGLLNLVNIMENNGCYKMIYSSSATVYGEPQKLPLDESHPLSAINPYGSTKMIGEFVLRDLAMHDKNWDAISLRYFNPAGAHPSGIIGEDYKEQPANLFPAICHSLYNPQFQLQIFGDDYDTKDGTCVRDIIHISDLVQGHIYALSKCLAEATGYQAVNLGSGTGFTVLEIMRTFEKELGEKLDYTIGERRAGDSVASYASTLRAKEYLGWETKHDLSTICRDTIKFYKEDSK